MKNVLLIGGSMDSSYILYIDGLEARLRLTAAEVKIKELEATIAELQKQLEYMGTRARKQEYEALRG